MKRNRIRNLKVVYESEYEVTFRIKVIPHQKDIKPKYYNCGYYKNDDTSMQRYIDKIDRLETLDYSNKPKRIYTGIDAKGRVMTLVKLGYNSNYCGQYAVRYYNGTGYSMKWQLVGIYKRLNDAMDTFFRRGEKI